MESSGQMAQGLPGGISPSGMSHGKQSTTGFVGGPRTGRCSRPPRSFRESSTQRAESTGSSWVRTARQFERVARQPAGRPMIKRDRTAREDSVVSPALGYEPVGSAGRILHLWYTLVTDGNGLLMATLFTAGQRHESAFFTDVVDQVRVPKPIGRPRKRPEAARGRPGLRLEREPTVVLGEKHRVGHSGPKRGAYRASGAYRPAMRKNMNTGMLSSAQWAA